MLVYRFEHDRDICKHSEFGATGESLTGHGTFTHCPTRTNVPNFGLSGSAPTEIMPHERCAVTASQFDDWIGYHSSCQYTSRTCTGEYYCWNCPSTRDLMITEGWHLVAYRLKDSSRGTDWRQDRGQIVFNPEFAERVGYVDVERIRKMAKRSLVKA